ncbi:MAG: hypothetical protein JSR60_14285 [Proteobacteria bacterium]|nr:hypothetical protein [Pseudomonadota bacterium]
MSEIAILNMLLFSGELFAASSLVVAVAYAATRRGPAARRHLIWCAALASLLLLPLLAAAIPGRAIATLPAPAVAADVPANLALAALPAVQAPPATESFHIDAATVIVVLAELWAAGALLILLRSGIATLVLRLFLRDSSEAPFEPVELPEVARLSRVRLRVSNRERGPITWGLFRPVILLPRQSLYWPCERLQAVMRHEFAHVQRHDGLTQALSLLVCALYWPNPLVWLGFREQRRAAEMAADDAVIVSGMTPSEYAGELLQVAAEFKGRAPAAALLMAAPSTLGNRVQSILSPSQNRRGVTAMDILKTAGIALLATTALVVARPSFAQEAPPPVPNVAAPIPPAPDAPATLPAPAAMPEPAAMPAPEAPPAPPAPPVIDRKVRIIRIGDAPDAKGHHHRTIRVEVDTPDADAIRAEIQPDLDRAMADVKAHQAEIYRIKLVMPKVKADVAKALAEVRAQLAQIDDPKIRAKVEAALARAQKSIETSGPSWDSLPDAPDAPDAP